MEHYNVVLYQLISAYSKKKSYNFECFISGYLKLHKKSRCIKTLRDFYCARLFMPAKIYAFKVCIISWFSFVPSPAFVIFRVYTRKNKKDLGSECR